MGYASLYAQTAKKRPSTMAQDKTLGRGEGLDMGAEGKEEALFQELFNEAQGAISKVYLPGTMAHAREHHKELYGSILNTEARLNESWLAMREGRNTLDQFSGALRIWQDLHFKAIGLYREQRDRGEEKQRSLF